MKSLLINKVTMDTKSSIVGNVVCCIKFSTCSILFNEIEFPFAG